MRKIVSIIGVAGMLAAGAAVVTPSSSAITPPVSFTADVATTSQTNGIVWALTNANGIVYTGGTFSATRPSGSAAGSNETPRANFASFDAATGAPSSCNPTFTISSGTATVRALALSADKKTLYVGGLFGGVNGVAVSNAAAINLTNCTVLTSWKPAFSATVRALAVSNGNVYAAGDFTKANNQVRRYFAEVNSTGVLQPWAPVGDKVGRGLSVTPDGSAIMLGGDFFTINGVDSHGVAVVNSTDGTVLRSYPNYLVNQNSVIKEISTDGTNFYAAGEGSGVGVFDGRIAFSTTAPYDMVWIDNCLGATQVTLPYKDVLYFGSHTHDCSSMNEQPNGVQQHLSAENTATPTLIGWNPDTNGGIGEKLGPRVMTVASSGSKNYLWVGGEFTTVNGVAQQSLARFTDGPDTTKPSTPTVTAVSTKTGQALVRWQSSLDLDDQTLTYRLYRNGGTTPIYTSTGDSLYWKRPQLNFTDTGLTPGATYTYRVTASDGTNTTPLSAAATVTVTSSPDAYANQVVADGASTYWRYDVSGSLAYDTAGDDPGKRASSGVNATYPTAAGMTFNTGNGPLANVNDSAMTIADGTQNAFVTTELRQPQQSYYTLETWFKTTSTSGGRILGWGSGSSQYISHYDKMIYLGNDGRLNFGAYNGNTNVVTSNSAYNNGQWHYVVATQGASGMTLYVDGIRVGSNNITTNEGGTGFWQAGGGTTTGWPNSPASPGLTGQIAETAIYPSALTGAMVRNHYALSGNGGTPISAPTDAYGNEVYNDNPELYWRLDETSGTTAADASGNGATGNYGGGYTQGVPGALAAGGTAVSFDGSTGDVISAVSEPTPSTYSTEAWFKTTSTNGGKIIGFGDNPNGVSGSYDKHTYMTNDGHLIFGVWNGHADTITTPNTYNDGAWHQVVSTQGPDGMSLYVDGALVGTNAATTSQDYSGYWHVGGDNLDSWPNQPNSRFFNGAIDEVSVYPTELTAAQVSAQFTAAGQAPDTQAPSVPTGVTASVTGTTATVSWNASTDNTGVAGYTVYRGASADFTPAAANKVGTPSTTSFTDSGLAPGTYYYKVTASDAANNESGASTAASATVAAPPVTLTATDTADTYANQGAPSTNYGSATSIASRGTSGYTSYLRFTLPSAPAGQTLKGVTLKLRTSSESFAGSADNQRISLANNTWGETTLNWNNRPALGAGTLGTLTAPNAISTPYSITLDASQLSSLLGSEITIAVSSSGTDNFWLVSREGTAASRPTLSLDFG